MFVARELSRAKWSVRPGLTAWMERSRAHGINVCYLKDEIRRNFSLSDILVRVYRRIGLLSSEKENSRSRTSRQFDGVSEANIVD